mmetsp:Transcript_16672/g.36043  ORF Transcript_16672/g.36043 Transcript_16672/m.36043 type:complete len:218 (+) Transcript_16672:83-736(+)
MHHRQPSLIIMMAAASLAFARSKVATQVMGWSSSSSFVPLTRSRTTVANGRFGSGAAIAKRSASSSISYLTKRSQMVMWGEEDAPKRDVAIPSSQFSSESDGGRRPVRPVRRSSSEGQSNSGGNDGWFDDADDPSYKSSPARRGEPSRSSSQKSSSSSSSGWDDVDHNDWDSVPSGGGGGGGKGGKRMRRLSSSQNNNNALPQKKRNLDQDVEGGPR